MSEWISEINKGQSVQYQNIIYSHRLIKLLGNSIKNITSKPIKLWLKILKKSCQFLHVLKNIKD